MTEDPSDEAEHPEGSEAPGEAIPLDITDHDRRERPDGGTELLPDDASEAGTRPAEPPAPHSATDRDEGDAGEDESTAEPVEVLVNLAEEGEIDPWDIDIVAVTDKFLNLLDAGDLRTTGRALFYASVLLRMKGDAMLDEGGDEPDDPWEEDPWEMDVADASGEGPDPFAALESEMDRRLERRRARGMPQTLDQLVRDLRDAERNSWWKESREYDTSDSPQGFARGTQELDYHTDDTRRMADEPTATEVTEKTHDEDIESVIADVHRALRTQYDKGRTEVLFREIETVGGTRVETYLALLFLAHRGQVRLSQDELFGDLWIQDPAATATAGEAVAD